MPYFEIYICLYETVLQFIGYFLKDPLFCDSLLQTMCPAHNVYIWLLIGRRHTRVHAAWSVVKSLLAFAHGD